MSNTIIIAVGIFAAAAVILYAIGRLAGWMWPDEHDPETDDN